MDIKRALWMSVFVYALSFVVGIIVALVSGIDFEETQEIPPLLWYAGAVTSVVLAGIFTLWYFRSPRTRPSAKEGFRFGLILIATGFVLDFVTLLPLFTHENPWEPILTYYQDVFFWATVALVLVTTTLVGKYKS